MDSDGDKVKGDSICPDDKVAISCRFSAEDFQRVCEIAKRERTSASKWIRKVALESLFRRRLRKPPKPKTPSIDSVDRALGSPPPRSWADEWVKMTHMAIPDMRVYFAKLQNGRPLPEGFKGWKVPDKLAWLNKEWPLS
jgi:hypothetical protein